MAAWLSSARGLLRWVNVVLIRYVTAVILVGLGIATGILVIIG